MKAAWWIAKRYFLFGKKFNFINVISLLSMTLVGVITMAMILILSGFNGMEDLIRRLFNSFDPQIKIEAAEGKTFKVSDSLYRRIQHPDIEVVSEVIEDYSFVMYKGMTSIVRLKGVSDNFVSQHRMDSVVKKGKLQFKEQGRYYAIVGQGVQYKLNVNVNNPFYPLTFYFPDPRKAHDVNASRSVAVIPGGVFEVEKQFDEKYVLVPLEAAQDLYGYEKERSALEVKVRPQVDPEGVKEFLQAKLGPAYRVLNSDEQHATLLRAIRMEKLVLAIALILFLIPSSLGIYYSLTLLTLSKKHDIALLQSLGAGSRTIRAIFLWEGMLIALCGSLIGLSLGIGICLAQQKFHLFDMGMQSSVIDYYPVKLLWGDILFSFAAVFLITLLASLRPAIRASRISVKDNL